MFELTDAVLVIHRFWVGFIALVIGGMVAFLQKDIDHKFFYKNEKRKTASLVFMHGA